MPILVIAAVVPALLFFYIVYRADRHKERPRFIIPLFIVGAVIVFPAGLIEKYLLDFYSVTINPPAGLLAILLVAFFVAGITEETLKAVLFQKLVYRTRHFNEPYDGIVYAVAIGLGFAMVENIMYVTSNGLSTAFVRAFTAVPAHTLFGIVMGSLFSESLFLKRPLYRAYIIPALLHGTYDAFALAQGYIANVLLIVYLMWLVRFAFLRAQNLRDQENPQRKSTQGLSAV